MPPTVGLEQSPLGSRRRDEPEFNLKEWGLKARISRENTNSRRFSASNLASLREEARSFRTNITISSTASSPGYTLREEIDPATYSFTTALKALQAKTVYSWECMSPDGLALNSKWNEAEKYICNPLSGEVPLECLSAKTLSGRSFRQLTSRITMSAPLIYPSHSRHFQSKPSIKVVEDKVQIPIKEKRRSMTRDVGTQSTPPYLSSNSPSPAPTPSSDEKSEMRSEAEGKNSSVSSSSLKTVDKVEMKETKAEEDTKRRDKGEKKKEKQESCNRCRQGGCLSCSWRSLWLKRRQREKHKPRKKNVCLYHINGC